MKIVIRMLKIVTVILWLIIVFFSVTAVFSVMDLGLTVGQVEMLPSNNGVTLSLPFTINNGGYCEIADLNVTTRVTNPDGKLLDQSQTVVPSIPQGNNVSAAHKVSIDLQTILSLDQTSLLLEDSDFNVEIFAGLNFARAVPVQLSTNTTIGWGAPFAQLSVGRLTVSDDSTGQAEATIPISFENHAILDIAGALKLDFYDGSQDLITSGTTVISVGSGQSYNGIVTLYLRAQDVSRLRSSGTVHMIFETPMFTVEWDEQYG